MGGVIFRVSGKLEYLKLDKLLDEKEVQGTEDPELPKYIAARKALKSLPSRNIDIQDRSKGDIVTKGITFIQTTWFIVHLAVRRLQNLEVTALEILTLAYAVVSIFTYICWWEKPLNVYNPIIIDLNVEPGALSSHSDAVDDPELRSSPPGTSALDQLPSSSFISFNSSHAHRWL